MAKKKQSQADRQKRKQRQQLKHKKKAQARSLRSGEPKLPPMNDLHVGRMFPDDDGIPVECEPDHWMTLEPDTPAIYQLLLTMRHSEPSIWRRVLVPNIMTLAELHEVIQTIMQWGDEHQHEFRIGEGSFGSPFVDSWSGQARIDDSETVLGRLLPGEGARFVYEYDFGDSWLLDALVEKTLPLEGAKDPVICLEGERAAPPEDFGGIYRYCDLVEEAADPNSEAAEEFRDMYGDDFDPTVFPLEQINLSLSGFWGWINTRGSTPETADFLAPDDE